MIPKVKSEDVVEEEVEPHSVVEKEGNEEEEFYTLEELDDLENQPMAYIARKFSNIIFKKNKAFKPMTIYMHFLKQHWVKGSLQRWVQYWIC